MAATKKTTFKERMEKRVLEKLTVSPSTIGDMANALDANYYTIRSVFKKLEDEGFLFVSSYKRGAQVYRLTEPDAKRPNNSIPVGKQGDRTIKLTAMLDLVGKEEQSATGVAAVSLPRNVVRLFMSALRHVDSNEKYPIDQNLKNIRLEMETHLAQLRNMANLYESVLQADVLWNPNKIKAIPYDETFDRDRVVEAYRHYYPED